MITISLEEQCLEYAQILGLNEPVPEAALKAALQNEEYARTLLLNSDAPRLLAWLLATPPVIPEAYAYSNYKLIGKAATAFFKWRRTRLYRSRRLARGYRQAPELAA